MYLRQEFIVLKVEIALTQKSRKFCLKQNNRSMTKHHWMESLKSFFESHVNPEKDGEVDRMEIETENKVQKILTLLKGEEDENTRGSSTMESLVDLIEEFHKEYQSLYARYDHLTGELRKRIYGKQVMENFSSSISDSDSDYSPRDKGSKNGEIQNDFQNVANGITHDTGNGPSAQIMMLMEQLNTSCGEKQELKSELLRKNQEMPEYLIEKENMRGRDSRTANVQRILDEKECLVLQVKDLEFEVESLRNQKIEVEKSLLRKITELEKRLAQRRDELFALNKKIENVENGMCAQVLALTEQVNNMQQKLDSLQDEKSQLEVQIEGDREDASESPTQIDNQKVEMASKIIDQERMLKDMEDAFTKLSDKHRQVEIWFLECKDNLQVAEKKIKDKAEEFQRCIEAKNVKIYEVTETIEDLRSDLDVKGDEVSSLVEFIRAIEFKLRLSNQKLRVTEQLLTENEQSHGIKEEKLRKEKQLLEEKNSTLSGAIAAYKETQYKMVTDISGTVYDILTGMDALTMKFEEDYGHFETCIYDVLNEVKVSKNWVKERNSEKEQLNKEIASMLEDLQNRREDESVLRDKIKELEENIGGLESKVQKNEDEKEFLVRAAKQLEDNIVELQKKIDEKNEGILGLGEEKKEAIRQLCIWIDYHRNRCDFFKDMLSEATNRRMQIT